MRIVFFSDIHGNQYAFESLLKNLSVDKPDKVIFGGDVFGYYYGQKCIIDSLMETDWECIMGNHDCYMLKLLHDEEMLGSLVAKYGKSYAENLQELTENEINYIRSFKSRIDIRVDGLNLVFLHGSVADPLNGRIYPDTVFDDLSMYNGIDYVFMGHTHHKMIKRLDNGTVLVNPGSVGQQRDGKGCTYIVFNSESQEIDVKTIEYDKNNIVDEIKKHHETKEMEDRLVEVLFRSK